MTDTVTLKSMRFHTHIGVLPHEAEIAQSIEVDLSVEVQRGEEVVDYRSLYDIVARVIGEGHIKYLEEVAERVAESALKIKSVEGVSVAVRKPHVALPGPLAYAEVAVNRSATNKVANKRVRGN
jgi:dihydroneopterin aldolase